MVACFHSSFTLTQHKYSRFLANCIRPASLVRQPWCGAYAVNARGEGVWGGAEASGAQGEGFYESAARVVGVRRGRSPYEDLSPAPARSAMLDMSTY